MKRFFIDEPGQNLEVGQIINLKPEDGKHLALVLRQKVGAEIHVVGDGRVFVAQLASVEQPVKAKLVAEVEETAEAQLGVYLLQGLAKGERMELVIQKAVELGAAALTPVACSRSVVQLSGAKAIDKQKRWQKIAESAAKQCGREKITEIRPVSSLGQAIIDLPEDTLLIMPWEEAGDKPEEQSLKAILQRKPPKNVAVIIGPEGGLTQREVDLAKKHNAKIVTLGKRILRTETAAIVMLAVLMYQWGDIGGNLEDK